MTHIPRIALSLVVGALGGTVLGAGLGSLADAAAPELEEKPSHLLLGAAVTGSGLGATTNALNPRVQSYLTGVAGIFEWGQSLGAGDFGVPANTSQVGNSVQLQNDAGYPFDAADPTWAIVPLVAPERANVYGGTGGQTATYSGNIGGESPDVCLIDSIYKLAHAAGYSGFELAASNTSQGGQAYAFIGWGGLNNPTATAAHVLEATVYERLAGSSFSVMMVSVNHGESDSQQTIPVYYNDLQALWQGYHDHVKVAITGQSHEIPLIISQQIAWPPPLGLSSENLSSLQQWQFCVDKPSECIMSGSKAGWHYQADHLHLTQHGYCNEGETEAHALWTWLNTSAWSPLWPMNAQLTGSVVTLTVAVPYGPIQIEGTLTLPHLSGTTWGDNGSQFGAGHTGWTAGKGFECWTGGTQGTAIGITAFAITSNPSGPNVTATIQITCASTPDTIAYGHTADNFAAGPGNALGGWADGVPGQTTSPLKDSDPYVGPMTGDSLPNRMVTFRCASLSGASSPCHE